MKKEQKAFDWQFVAIVASIVLLAWGGSWALIDWLISDDSARGAFGDKFGAVNALFSGLAFAGLIVTLLFQKRELKLQREELSYTREELAGQRDELQKQGEAFIEQNKAINQQRFENTFFNLLDGHQKIISRIPQIQHTVNGKICDNDYLKDIYDRSSCYSIGAQSHRGKLNDEEWQNEGIKVFHRRIESPYLWNYYAYLYRILKFVDTSSLINDGERYDYICILRAQLSYQELWILFYHCLNERACDKFKPLVEKYALFNNLDLGMLFSEEDKEKYGAGAYEYTAPPR